MRRLCTSLAGPCALALALAGCAEPAATEPEPEAAPTPSYDQLDRRSFNQRAARHNLGVFWAEDEDGTLDPHELIPLWGTHGLQRTWVMADSFNPLFEEAYRELVEDAPPPVGEPGSEARRRAKVREELDQVRPTLIHTDLSELPEADRTMATHVLAAAELIERLYAQQRGAAGLPAPEDAPSRALVGRNQGPWCEQPATADDPDCHALQSRAPRVSGLYPVELQERDPDFCQTLAEHPAAQQLLDPFTVVRSTDGGQLRALPYSEAFADEMMAVKRELRDAAAALGNDEAALAAYLEAAAAAFESNDWHAADEAWAAMSAGNSKWYLRIGPDETYFEPCDRKAGFHVSFARINPGSVAWQERLDPLKAEMEREIAGLAGPPYRAREVSFHLPDFIDIVLNAGDSRDPRGATIGQSLPNWGPVADEGRGRTVAMTNLGTDPDSLADRRRIADSLFCPATAQQLVADPEPLLLSTVLHEAAHNLGPSHSYRVRGKTADEAFGGSLASTMEELKAQTAAWVLIDWLHEQGQVEAVLAEQAAVADLYWALGQIARGMYSAGQPRSYGQLAAIQLGFLLESGAASWHPTKLNAAGAERGCLQLSVEDFPAAARELGAEVFGLKARNDAQAARALVEHHVDGEGPATPLFETIAARFAQVPGVVYVYAIQR